MLRRVHHQRGCLRNDLVDLLWLLRAIGRRGALLGLPPVQVVTQVVEMSGFERACGLRALAAGMRAAAEEEPM